MRGTWLAKTNNFRCFWGSSEKNWKQRLHFESFVPQFSSESSHFPGVPCHILMCCASRRRFYITSLWSYPLSSVMRVTCRRESLLILLTICWLIPWFLYLSITLWIVDIVYQWYINWARRSWCPNGESSETRWEEKKQVELGGFLKWVHIVHGPRDLDYLKTTFEKMM